METPSLPWIDGGGAREAYSCAFYDDIEDHNASKMKSSNRILCLSHLYGRAEKVVPDVESNIRSEQDALQMIVDCILKRDSIYVTSLVFTELHATHTSIRRHDEILSSIEAHFTVLLTRFNGLDPTIAILNSM